MHCGSPFLIDVLKSLQDHPKAPRDLSKIQKNRSKMPASGCHCRSWGHCKRPGYPPLWGSFFLTWTLSTSTIDLDRIYGLARYKWVFNRQGLGLGQSAFVVVDPCTSILPPGLQGPRCRSDVDIELDPDLLAQYFERFA